MNKTMAFSVEDLINCVKNEHVLWHADSSEEDKDMGGHRVASNFGCLTGKQSH